ncbi:hypothetical protein BX666DRAFT_1877110 [Dichotomocladium elegans]|nr:hypothetical protein BX666DRAFT_1877110 [Dichotomocladium elegans]
MSLDNENNRKRSFSPDSLSGTSSRKKQSRLCSSADLLAELTNVLSEIRSTPSSGEISAELLETFKIVMLQIEHMSSDSTNTEAAHIKHESGRCLDSWFDELLAQCEADGELDLDELEDELATAAIAAGSDDDEDIQTALRLAFMLTNEDGDDEEDIKDEADSPTTIQLLV